MSAIDRLELALNGNYLETGVHGLRSQLGDQLKWLSHYEESVEIAKSKIEEIEKEIEDVEKAIIQLMDNVYDQ